MKSYMVISKSYFTRLRRLAEENTFDDTNIEIMKVGAV